MEERIRILEERLAHQQVLVETLDDIVRGYVTRLERLERQLGELASRIDSGGGGDFGPANERPPHY